MAADEDETAGKTPEECQDLGLWEVDVVYYSLNGNNKADPSKSKRGKAYKGRSDSEYKCFEAYDGVLYRPGDHVFMEASQCEPFCIGTISSFKMTKRDQLMVKITRFYRPEDVPEASYSLLIQERKEDTSLNQEVLSALQTREIFSSDVPLGYSISHLRGKCMVRSIKDVRSLTPYDVLNSHDTFFCLVSFDPLNNRLASMQGEIRVGPSYQAVDSPLESCSEADEPDRDELLYRPGYIDEDEEKVFVKTARAFRIYAMARNENITDLERDFRTGDLVFHDAIVTLHKCGYNAKRAIEAMNRIDDRIVKETRFLTGGDAKKFAKGIKTYGKNFLKIKSELLPRHERSDLVQFYYRWKKTSDATRPRALTRPRNSTANPYRKAKNNQPKTPHPNPDLADYESASETEMEELMSEGRATGYACHHCYSSKSKDWHHSGKDRQLLCTDCRIFYKKYGHLRQVDRPSAVPPSLHKARTLETPKEEEQGVRTRAGKKERRRTPSDTDRKNSSPISPSDGEVKQRNGKRKRNHQQTPEHTNGAIKRKALKEEKDAAVEEFKSEEKSGMDEPEKNQQDQTSNLDKHLKVEGESCIENGSNPSLSGSINTAECSLVNGVHHSDAAGTFSSMCTNKASTSANVSSSITTPVISDVVAKSYEKNEKMFTQSPMSGTGKVSLSLPNIIAEDVPSTSSNHIDDMQKRKEEEIEEDSRWMVGTKVVLISEHSQFVRAIERGTDLTCARSDLIYQQKPGVHRHKNQENNSTSLKKNSIIGDKVSHKKSIESQCATSGNASAVSSSVSLPVMPNASGVDAFMGGRVPMNGTAVNGIPGIFPGVPDPRFGFINPQQYAMALEQAALQKQIEQHVRATQFELMRNGGNGQVPSNAMRESPSRNIANPHNVPPAMIGAQFHNNFSTMDPRALATILHNPQLASQFGIAMDGGHAAAMLSAMEQRAVEQRMLAGVGGMDLIGPNSIQAAAQAQPSHIHPHAAAMMQHAVAAQQTNGDSLQLQQLLAMSAAAQTPRPFVDQPLLQHMSMMNPFGQEMAARLVNPGALNSDMMRRLQQEGGFTNPNQRS